MVLDKRIIKISRLLSEFAAGIFTGKLPISPKQDDIDALMNGINMLGEELQSTRILKDYFNDIFNAVSDMVFILNSKGNIIDLNKAVTLQLGYAREQLLGKTIRHLHGSDKPFSSAWLKYVKTSQDISYMNSFFKSADGGQVPVHVSTGLLPDSSERRIKILITAQNTSRRLLDENTVIRAMIDAEEEERHHIVNKIYGSLGQQLAAIKFHIGALSENCQDKTLVEKLSVPNKAITEAIAEMRDICFNLGPSTLKKFGLVHALEELAHQPAYQGKIHLIVNKDCDFSFLPVEIGVDIFRVIQEFVTNAFEHGKADKVMIQGDYDHQHVHFLLSDDGKGFDLNKYGSGNGLRNAHSRVKSHQGRITIDSTPGKGTTYKLSIPFNALN